VHRALLRLPLIGPLITDVNIITMARTMNLLLKGGVRIVEALEISGKSLNNLVYKQQIEDIGGAVRRGDRMSKLMIQRPQFFPATFSEMSNVGETTGKLDETLEFLAEFYESELDSATKTLSNVLEPILLLGMGLVVSFVAISIITPIYKISQTLGR
jgi:type IV pilus assembly protein PilC